MRFFTFLWYASFLFSLSYLFWVGKIYFLWTEFLFDGVFMLFLAAQLVFLFACCF